MDYIYGPHQWIICNDHIYGLYLWAISMGYVDGLYLWVILISYTIGFLRSQWTGNRALPTKPWSQPMQCLWDCQSVNDFQTPCFLVGKEYIDALTEKPFSSRTVSAGQKRKFVQHCLGPIWPIDAGMWPQINDEEIPIPAWPTESPGADRAADYNSPLVPTSHTELMPLETAPLWNAPIVASVTETVVDLGGVMHEPIIASKVAPQRFISMIGTAKPLPIPATRAAKVTQMVRRLRRAAVTKIKLRRLSRKCSKARTDQTARVTPGSGEVSVLSTRKSQLASGLS